MFSNIGSHLSGRERTGILICAGVVGVSLLLKLAVQPALAKMEKLDQLLISKKIELAKTKKLASLKDAAEKLQKDRKNARPDGNDAQGMSLFLREMDQLIKKHSLKVNSIKPLPVDEKGAYRTYSLELQADGSMSGLTEFLYSIQKSSTMMRVKKLNILNGTESQLQARALVSKSVWADRNP